MKKNKPRIRYPALFVSLWLVLFVPAGLVCQANPFTSQQDSSDLSPVRVGRPVAEISRVQTELRNALADYFYDWKTERSPGILWSVLGIAFLYGILHALGPGHRKMVVFSIFLARPSRFWEPLSVGLLLSALHAGASVAIMLALRGVTGTLSGASATISVLMEGVAYSVLVLMSLFLLFHAIVSLAGRKPHEDKMIGIGTLLLTGIYPCPGAILILVLSVSLEMMGLGVMAVGAMSLGMSLPIIAMGYLAAFGRTQIVAGAIKNKRFITLVSGGVEIFGYAFLFAFSLFIAFPFLASLMKLLASGISR